MDEHGRDVARVVLGRLAADEPIVSKCLLQASKKEDERAVFHRSGAAFYYV